MRLIQLQKDTLISEHKSVLLISLVMEDKGMLEIARLRLNHKSLDFALAAATFGLLPVADKNAASES